MELLGTVDLDSTGVLVYNVSAENVEKLETALKAKEQGIREQIAKEIEALSITITADPSRTAGLQSASRNMQLRCAAIARGQK